MKNNAFTLKGTFKEAAFAALDRAAPLFSRPRPIDRKSVRSILAVQGGGIGDVIMAMPALHGLRRSFPDASFSLMTSPAARPIVAHYPLGDMLDEIIEFDFKGKQKRFSEKTALLLELRNRRYDLIYWASRGEGMREECAMGLIIGAPHRIGFTRRRTGAYNTIQREFNDHESIRRQNTGLLEAAGLQMPEKADRMTIAPSHVVRARALLGERIGDPCAGPLVAVHPGCSWGGNFKSWPARRFQSLIRELIRTAGVRVVIIGSRAERAADQGFAAGLGSSAADLAGETSISELAALIGMSQLFIGNDSGPLHIATALGVPAIGIFGPTSVTHLVSEPEKCVVIRKQMPCSPCYSHQHRFAPTCVSPRCLEEVTVDEVLLAARTVIDRSAASCV